MWKQEAGRILIILPTFVPSSAQPLTFEEEETVCCVLGSLGGVVVIEVIIMVQIKCKCPLCFVFTAYLEHEHGPADDL